MNATIKLLKAHTSIRKFNDQPVTTEQEQSIIASAMRGATSGNMMLYSIIKIRSKDTLLNLAKSCDDQLFIEKASLALLFVLDSSKWTRLFENRHIKEDFPEYSGPTISDFIFGMQDSMIAAQNAVIAAESMGIGTCYIGDIMENYEYHKELFRLPKYVMPATLVVFGHYDSKPERRERFDEECVVFNEVYPIIEQSFIDHMFEGKELINPDFAKNFYARKIDAPFYNELIRSIECYLKEWR